MRRDSLLMLLALAFLLNNQVLNEKKWMKALIFIGKFPAEFGLRIWDFSTHTERKKTRKPCFYLASYASRARGHLCRVLETWVLPCVLHTRGVWEHTWGALLQLPMRFCHFLRSFVCFVSSNWSWDLGKSSLNL